MKSMLETKISIVLLFAFYYSIDFCVISSITKGTNEQNVAFSRRQDIPFFFPRLTQNFIIWRLHKHEYNGSGAFKNICSFTSSISKVFVNHYLDELQICTE